MYRVLVVEDDSIIRRGLVKIIGEMGLPLETVEEAENGESALALCELIRPHLVITDIRMPLMDGLGLIEQLHGEASAPLFVILSGYSDFEYARRAITYGVREYLLKPIDKEELKASLVRLLEELARQQAAEEESLREMAQYTAQIRDYRRGLYWDILAGVNSPAELERKASLLGGEAENAACLVAVGHDAAGAEDAHTIEEVMRAAYPEAEALLHNRTPYGYQVALLRLSGGQTPDFSDTGLAAMAKHLQEEKQARWPHFTMALGGAAGARALPEAFRRCRALLDARLLFGTRGMVLPAITQPPAPAEPLPAFQVRGIRAAIEEKDDALLDRKIKEYFAEVQRQNGITPARLVQAAKAMELSVLVHSPDQYSYYEKTLDQLQTFEFLLSASATLQDFVDAVVSRISTLGQNTQPHTTVSPVEQVIRYVERHYAKDISLVYAANLASMNTSYFSTLFKKKTGLPFTAYLQDIRIQNARELLRDPAIKVFEVAERVGFRDEKYFMKVFKNAVGKTPSEYKETGGE